MAETMARLHPLAAVKTVADPHLLAQGPMGRFSLRLAANAAPAPLGALGLSLPLAPCRAAQSETAAALWLGPGEWLLLTAPERASAVEAALRAELAGQAFSLVEISHRQTGLSLSGPRAAQRLNAGCPLDLDLASFPVGMCTRTVFAKAEIVLWRTGVEAFHIEVWRSFVPYLWELLVIVGAEAS